MNIFHSSFLHLVLFCAIFALVFAFGGSVAKADAATPTSVKQVITPDGLCSGTPTGGSPAGSGNLTAFDTAYLPTDYATVGRYCIQKTVTNQCTTDSSSITYKLYNTDAEGAYGGGHFCYLPYGEPDRPPRINYSAITYENPTATLTAAPSTIHSGDSALLTWSSAYATSCTGTGFSTGGATFGSVSVTPSSNQTYSVSCNLGSLVATDSETVTVIPPLSSSTVSCSASPTSALVGQSVQWTSLVSGGVSPYTYFWSGDGDISGATSANPSLSYDSGGTKMTGKTISAD